MRITVVGDVSLDRDLPGGPSVEGPEGVPVVAVGPGEQRAGGAGLVARMLARDGHDVTLVTALGFDAAAQELRAELGGIRLVAGASRAPTPIKTRIRADGTTLLRFDEGCGPAPVPTATAAMLEAVSAAGVLLASDHGRGLLRGGALRARLERRAANVPLIWDPHSKGPLPVPGSLAVTPNLPEARAASGAIGRGASAIGASALRLRANWRVHTVVVTLGPEGALVAGAGVTLLPTAPAAISDPCGAGDRFAATLAVELGNGAGVRASAAKAVAVATQFLVTGGVGGWRGVDLSDRRERLVRIS